jgi:hypothetical protein
MIELTPSYNHAIFAHPLKDGIAVGFYIENGNNPALIPYVEGVNRTIVPTTDEALARSRLEPIRTDLQAQGYNVGKIETKSHRDWCLEIFGALE